jgi:hypothetical protein
MNRKQFVVILLALAIVGSAGLIVVNRHKQSWNVCETKVGEKLMPNFRPNDVAAIHIKGASHLNIENKDGVWRVRERGGYPANYDQIKALLVRMKDIKIVQSDQVGPSLRGRVELGEPGRGPGSGTLVEFKDAHGNVLDSVVMGKRHLRPETASDPFRMHGVFDGCYVLSPKEPENVLLISDELASVSGEPGAWLNKEFCKIENVKSFSLAGTNGANLWTLTRESQSKPWTLADAKPAETLDAPTAAQTAELLNFLSFVDVVTESEGVGSAGFSQSAEMKMKKVKTDPFAKPIVISVETFDHFFYALKIEPPALPGGNYQIMLAVRAELPSERVADSDEKPEDKKSLESEFRVRTTQLRDKLAKESRLASNGFGYVIQPRLIEPLLCDRAHLLEKRALAGLKGADLR